MCQSRSDKYHMGKKLLTLTILLLLLSLPALALEKPTVAVANLQGKAISQMYAEQISDFLRSSLSNTAMLTMTNRTNMEQILNEQQFQQTGCTSQECAVKIGKILNVKKMIVGTTGLFAGKYYINISYVDVETTEVDFSERVDFDKLENAINMCDVLSSKITDRLKSTMPSYKESESKPTQEELGKYINMVLIPAGEFMMGSDSGEKNEHPQHKVFLDTYYIDKYEVTFTQYDKFCEATKRKKPSDNGWGRGNMPVINVNWNDANDYAEWAGKRLPTEAEWEKACKAGANTKYCFGNNASELAYYAWYDRNSRGIIHPVGQNKPNNRGIYDMHGNVWEWCADWYDENYYRNSNTINPQGPAISSDRVLRGGGWNNYDFYCRSAYRDGYNAVNWHNDIGFRCASGVAP